MSERITLLDHGYIQQIDVWGSDERIIEAARMSTGKGFQGWGPVCIQCGAVPFEGKYPEGPCSGAVAGDTTHAMRAGDEKLLKYLWDHKHQTPFEMAGMTIEVQAPIFVFREWHRHRVPFGYNEMSARYTPLPDVNYLPTVERLMLNAGGTNKQAGTVAGAEALTVEAAETFRRYLVAVYADAQHLYEQALSFGIPKELARIHLPVGRYSRMRATSNLRGWLGFLALRMAPSAQYEIRQYANVLHGLLGNVFPRTLALFDAGRGAA